MIVNESGEIVDRKSAFLYKSMNSIILHVAIIIVVLVCAKLIT